MNFYCIIYGTVDELMTLNIGCEENLAAIYANDPEGKLIIKEDGMVVTVLYWGLVQGVVDNTVNERRLVAAGKESSVLVPDFKLQK